MTDIIVAKLQNRRGLRRDLPQPLSPGELGLCIDTRELFIGADPGDPNSVISPEITAYTPSAGSQIEIDMICREYIVEIELNTGATHPESIDGVRKVVIVDRDDGLGGITSTAYIGYDIPMILGVPQPITLPNLGIGTERFFSDDLLVPTNLFINSTLALSSTTVTGKYNVSDAGAVSSLINYVAGGPGLTTVNQNIRILTDVSPQAGDDTLVHPFSVDLPATSIWTRIPSFTYAAVESDVFVSEYSVNSFDPAYTPLPLSTKTGNYKRNGKLKIVECDGEALLSDESIEVNNSDYGVAFFFKAVYNAGNTELWYMTTPGPTRHFVVSFNTRRWISF